MKTLRQATIRSKLEAGLSSNDTYTDSILLLLFSPFSCPVGEGCHRPSGEGSVPGPGPLHVKRFVPSFSGWACPVGRVRLMAMFKNPADARFTTLRDNTSGLSEPLLFLSFCFSFLFSCLCGFPVQVSCSVTISLSVMSKTGLLPFANLSSATTTYKFDNRMPN